MNAFQKLNFKLNFSIVQGISCYEQDEMGWTRGSVPQMFPTVFRSQNNFIILNPPFSYNGIFPSVYFQDQPEVNLSFKTKQYCTDV